MTGKLDARVALVTGGTRGIGRAIAEAFVAEGASVVVNGRSEEKGQRALVEMDAGERARFVAGDITRKEDCEALIDGTVDLYGRLDILVNNAGGLSGWALVHELPDDAWFGTLDWNLNSTFFTTRRALPHMMRNSWGRILNVSSVESKTTNKPAISPYIVTKAAINAFTRVVAFEYAPYGITANAICPGAIETDIMKEGGAQAAAAAGITYEQFIQNYANESMIKRINTVEEVAAVALLLASEIAGGITGSMYNVDGGTSPW